MIGDMVGVVDALGASQAVIAGHDWGAPVAWHAALLRPDRFRAVIGLSVPFRPRGAVRPTSVMRQDDHAQFYQLYFQTPGLAEVELERDPRRSVRTILYSVSGDDPADGGNPAIVGGFLNAMTDPARLPSWITDADVDYYAGEFARTGFRGGLNWYRNIDRNWELMAPFAGLRVTVPALYITGDRDLAVGSRGAKELIANLSKFVPQLRGTMMLHGCGHWTQQERASEVSAAMIGFLKDLA